MIRAENGQFRHNRASNIKLQLRMKILHNQRIGTQTSFSTNFDDKLSFILSFLFPERLSITATYISSLLPVQLL